MANQLKWFYAKAEDHFRYLDWWRENRNDFLATLKARFARVVSDNKLSFGDYLEYFGIPLIVVWGFLEFYFCKSFFSADGIGLTVIFAGLFFWIQAMAQHIIKLTSWRQFRVYEYPEIASEFVALCLDRDLAQLKDPSDIADMKSFYAYCEKELRWESISWNDLSKKKADKV